MRKLVLMVGLTVVAVACGTAGDMVGEILDSGVPDADASIGMDGSTGGTSGAAGTNGSAGTNGTAGTGGSPGADVSVSCNKSDVKRYDEGESSARTVTTRYAEFEVTPGETEVTTCTAGDPDAYWPTSRRDRCYRGKPGWYRGTSTGFVLCGAHTDWDDDERFTDSNTPDPLSITVHN